MRTVSALAILLCLVGRVSADGNRLAYLDHLDPYYVSTSFPKLITPQWVGEEGVDCVIVLAIDDMRDVSKYERYLRPILDRLKKIDGRAPVSIMTNSVDPEDTATRSQLKSWLEEGLSIEALLDTKLDFEDARAIAYEGIGRAASLSSGSRSGSR